MTTFHIITLFPNSVDAYMSESILKRAREDKKIKVLFYNPRDYAVDKWDRIDDKPYGGGPGMVIEAEPVIKAIAAAKKKIKSAKSKIIWFSPQGVQFDTAYAKKAAKSYKHIVLVCGRYEGIDARVKKVFRVEEVSVGPFVVTGGEVPAMIVVDCISRQIPGVLGDINSLEENRAASNDVYTRPREFAYKGKNYKVPAILLGGHHAKIDEWRKQLTEVAKKKHELK